ncbi:hypothetical protein GQ472_00735 [archaeon]|nr:hypothetical protein [archaeon]
MKSTIRLFKGLPIKDAGVRAGGQDNLWDKTIAKGFIFAPEVIKAYPETELVKLIDVVDAELGLSAGQMNSSFHKSWVKVRDASMEQLFLEQVIHYLTTYGFKELGIFNEASVYIPAEKLDIPDLEVSDLNLVIIHGYTMVELKEKVTGLIRSGIALNEETILDAVDVVKLVGMDNDEILGIKNKEVRIAMYEHMDILPEDPVEFLRCMVYIATDSTLLIKDKMSIDKIRSYTAETDMTITDVKGVEYPNKTQLYRLVMRYEGQVGLERLAEIFYRFKPLFLAFRTDKGLRYVINRIRRLARKHHVPMRHDYLNDITCNIKNKVKIDDARLDTELGKVNAFRKIRLAYALKYRTMDVDTILYKVRNGRGYATKFKFDEKKEASRVLDKVLASLTKDMAKNVSGKKVYIPDHVRYTLPASEKQFTGNYPSGSYIIVPKDMVFGIHWYDAENKTIDLDLSLIGLDMGKIGWDSTYKSDDRNILFSGDLTTAPKPNGSSELFYVKRQEDKACIVMLNYFNYDKDIPVPFKILVAQEKVDDLTKNYMVDPNNVLSVCRSVIDRIQRIIGLVVTTPEDCRFYFCESDLGDKRSASNDAFVDDSLKYIFSFYHDSICLNDMLVSAGCIMVDDKECCDIDLSPEALEKDTILNLLR